MISYVSWKILSYCMLEMLLWLQVTGTPIHREEMVLSIRTLKDVRECCSHIVNERSWMFYKISCFQLYQLFLFLAAFLALHASFHSYAQSLMAAIVSSSRQKRILVCFSSLRLFCQKRKFSFKVNIRPPLISHCHIPSSVCNGGYRS